MAKVASSFRCLVCEENLKFPADFGIVDFTISFLQFYKDHDRCEQLEIAMQKKIETKKNEGSETINAPVPVKRKKK